METRLAIIADIHSNLEALSAVLDDARSRSVTDFYCLGDVVGYNANPRECLEIVRDIAKSTVCGNHDFYCSHDQSLDDFQPHAAAVVDWTRRQIDSDGAKWLSGLPFSKKIFPGSFTIVHGTLDNPDKWGYVFDSFDAESHFTYQQTAVCFNGHTHVPLVFEKRGSDILRYENPNPGCVVNLAFARKYFINPGSVGQPRDEIKDASYVIYDPQASTIEFRRIPYDIETAAEKIRKAGLPGRLAERLFQGR